MSLRKLKVGDRVRIIRLPPIWNTAGYVVPLSTRRVFDQLFNRGRPVRVREVDERGDAWISCRLRGKDGRIVHHSITLDDGCWLRVVPRERKAK